MLSVTASVFQFVKHCTELAGWRFFPRPEALELHFLKLGRLALKVCDADPRKFSSPDV